MSLHEAAYQPVPLLVAVQLLQHREHVREQALEIVEKELAVDRHAAILDAFGRGRFLRITYVGRERVLLLLELGAVSHWRPLPGWPAVASP